MAKTITLRDKTTREELYPKTLVNNVFDESNKSLTSILSKKADLVDGVIPLSQLPSSLTGEDSAKKIIINGVSGTLDNEGNTTINISGKNIKISSSYTKSENFSDDITESSTVDEAMGALAGNTSILKTIIGVEENTYIPPTDSIYIHEATSIKDAVETLDKSINRYADNLFKWSENN